MRSILVILLITVTIAYSLPSEVSVWKPFSFICTPCATQAECDAPPEHFCQYGEVRNPCNKRVCAKGPGESCGGLFNRFGQCGEGLMCKFDERCHGCSIQTMQCDE